MELLVLSGEKRTLQLRIITDCNDVVESLLFEITEGFRCMCGDVDSSLFHRLDRHGMNKSRGMCAGTVYLNQVAPVCAKQSFGDLAPRCVSCAEDENSDHDVRLLADWL